MGEDGMRPEGMTTEGALRSRFAGEEALWVVDVPTQTLRGWTRGRAFGPLAVSTALAGVGNEEGSGRTPLGAHRVVEVVGVGAVLGQPFVSRRPVGTALREFRGGGGDWILTRVLVLEGLEPALNGNSRARYIYLHGTAEEEKLGRVASHGCIRLANADIAVLADGLAELRPIVWIGALLPG